MTTPTNSSQPNQSGSPVVPSDPFGSIKDPKKDAPGVVSPREVNEFHTKSDADSSQQAQHHTIGLKRNQAASGAHIHDGQSARLIGSGLKLTVTGTKTAPTVQQVADSLGNLIAQLQQVMDIKDSRT